MNFYLFLALIKREIKYILPCSLNHGRRQQVPYGLRRKKKFNLKKFEVENLSMPSLWWPLQTTNELIQENFCINMLITQIPKMAKNNFENKIKTNVYFKYFQNNHNFLIYQRGPQLIIYTSGTSISSSPQASLYNTFH